MREICHVTVDGPCITKGSTAWGKQADELEDMRRRISEQCAPLREERWLRHGLFARVHFYLHSQRLKLTDLDNMAKVVLDAAFSSMGDVSDGNRDRYVWGLDLRKIDSGNEASQRTEIWFFDEEPR